MAHPMADAIKESVPALKQLYDIEVRKDLAVNIGSCLVCRCKDEEIFEILLGNVVVRLCYDCFNTLSWKVSNLK